MIYNVYFGKNIYDIADSVWILKVEYDVTDLCTRALQSFVIRFDFESYVRFEIRFLLMVRFEIFESSALSFVIRKETIGGG